ncbi:MAG: hypothetical protein IJW48_00960 [Clostridia bacterium]|nr:hypothetical protein [Clostridia bacterium]
MALIICEKCGKKFSDSLSACIHCGHDPSVKISEDTLRPTSEPENNIIQEKQTEVVSKTLEAPEDGGESKKIVNFNLLFEDEQDALEKEFLLENPVILKHKKVDSLILELLITFIFLAIVSALTPLWIGVLSFYINNYSMLIPVLSVCVAVFVLSVVCGVFSFISLRIRSHGKMSKIETDQFVKWLKESKNIIIDNK